jgi:exodeoxyribonuclease-3
VKIATFNINNVNRRLPNLLDWLREAKPDIACLQELKATDSEFPARAIEKAGYGAVWRGQKSWNGVAILARKAEPVLTRIELPGGSDDQEARYIEAAVRGIIPVILAGDYNVAPTPFDIYPTQSWDKDALIQPESRAAFARLLAQGWTDAIRSLHPDQPMFTLWHYMRNRWQRDAGLRLDHLLLSPALGPRLVRAGVDRKIRGEHDASDHAPAWVVLR